MVHSFLKEKVLKKLSHKYYHGENCVKNHAHDWELIATCWFLLVTICREKWAEG